MRPLWRISTTVFFICPLDDLRWCLWTGLTARSLSGVYFFVMTSGPWQGLPRERDSYKHPPDLLFPKVVFIACPHRNALKRPETHVICVSCFSGGTTVYHHDTFTLTTKRNKNCWFVSVIKTYRLFTPCISRRKITNSARASFYWRSTATQHWARSRAAAPPHKRFQHITTWARRSVKPTPSTSLLEFKFKPSSGNLIGQF